MLSKLVTIFAILQAVLAGETIVLEPPTTSETAKDIAVVWIVGAVSKQESYVKIAKAFQAEAAAEGYNAWVGIPHFLGDLPELLQFNGAIQKAKDDLSGKGFDESKGDYFIASHSLGTVISQTYIQTNQFKTGDFKGQILMGGGIMRYHRTYNKETGTTSFSNKIPTLTIAGELDGLYKIFRAGEGYWHGVQNIDPAEQGNFPVHVAIGVSHGSFMDEDILPAKVMKDDLRPEVSQSEAHKDVANKMINFIKYINGEGPDVNQANDVSAVFFKPIVDSLIMEGSYNLRVSCYNTSIINPDCERGNKWVTEAQKMMAGDYAKDNIDIDFFDSSHRHEGHFANHFSQIEDNKICDGKNQCTLKGQTVSYNKYLLINKLDTGFEQTSAQETKAKLFSKQTIKIHSGHPDANFTETDDNHHSCKDINQKALEKGLSMASPKAIERYNKFGKKLVMGEDKGPIKIGPIWIATYLTYTDNADKTETTVVAPYLTTPANFLIPSAAGAHYCKLLNPSTVLEWIYVTSLLERDGRTPYTQETMFLQ